MRKYPVFLVIAFLGSLFLSDGIQAEPAVTDSKVKALFLQLGSPSFKDREKASKALRDLGPSIAAPLIHEMVNHQSLEAYRRAERVFVALGVRAVLPLVSVVRSNSSNAERETAWQILHKEFRLSAAEAPEIFDASENLAVSSRAFRGAVLFLFVREPSKTVMYFQGGKSFAQDSKKGFDPDRKYCVFSNYGGDLSPVVQGQNRYLGFDVITANECDMDELQPHLFLGFSNGAPGLRCYTDKGKLHSCNDFSVKTLYEIFGDRLRIFDNPAWK